MHDIIAIILIVGWMVGLVAVVSAVLAKLGGWRRYAAMYPPVEPADDAKRMIGSLSMGGAARYNNAIIFRIDDDHLHMKMMPILPFHPRMSIPTVAIESIEPHYWKGWSKVTIPGKTMVMPTRIVQREIDARELLEQAGDLEAPEAQPVGEPA